MYHSTWPKNFCTNFELEIDSHSATQKECALDTTAIRVRKVCSVYSLTHIPHILQTPRTLKIVSRTKCEQTPSRKHTNQYIYIVSHRKWICNCRKSRNCTIVHTTQKKKPHHPAPICSIQCENNRSVLCLVTTTRCLCI